MSVYQCTESAYAKINFFLRITGRRDDGYHTLSTLMQTVSLADTVRICVSDDADKDGMKPGIRLAANVPGIPTDARNTAYKAARAFLDSLGRCNIGIEITLDKVIPSQAGMAGGSSDAAAVLRGLNRIFTETMSGEALARAASAVGADVPFCLKGGTQMCEGIGDLLTPKPSLQGVPVLLIKPSFGVSTPWAFSEYDREIHDASAGREAEARLLRILFDDVGKSPTQRIAEASSLFTNDLEPVVARRHFAVEQLRTALLEEGAVAARMSGSGSTVFGAFATADGRDRAAGNLRGKMDPAYVLYPVLTCDL